jgi:GNAT superfamily N-acetyltransferase
MTYLTADELATTQALIDEKINFATALGLTLHVDDNLENWKEHIESVPGGTGASKTIDPTVNFIRPGNSFWIYLKDEKDRKVACQANRFIETEDFVQEYVCTHRFFGDRAPTLHYFPVQLCESVPMLRGRIDFGAGTWVHPEYRGKGLSGLMSRTGRTLALRHFLIDYFVAFIVATGKRRQYGANGLGLSNRRHLLTGRYPGRDDNLNVDIYWMHRGELMSQIAQELVEGDRNPVALNMRTA